jgi:hypothetical protein
MIKTTATIVASVLLSVGFVWFSEEAPNFGAGLRVSTTATSTFPDGINIQQGCFTIAGGSCITASSGSGITAALTASTTITGATTPQPVYLATSTGAVSLSDANVAVAKNFIGFATTNATNGTSVTVQTAGVVSGFTGLTAGREYFVQDAEGTIGTNTGTATIYVGRAISSTQVYIDPTWQDQYLGVATGVNTNGSISVPLYTRKVVVSIAASDDTSSNQTATLYFHGVTTATVVACEIGTGVCNSSPTLTVTWATSTNQLTGSGNTGSGTAYFYR